MEQVIGRKRKVGFSISSKIHTISRCQRFMEEFKKLNTVEEGTYGIVYRALHLSSNSIVALKKVKMEKEKEGFPLTSLREIQISTLLGDHPNIVNTKQVVVGEDMDTIFIVMEFVEHELKALMEDKMKAPFSLSEIKCLMLQLLRGVHHMHDNWVIHRDLKTSNLLYSNKGMLKICDFGLAREYGSPLKAYTQPVVTLWYRAPELLLGIKKYSTAIDMWSVGCIFAELLSNKPLFPGKTELEQIRKISNVLGAPDWPQMMELPFAKRINWGKQPSKLGAKFPSLSNNGFDLLSRMLEYDPEKRITALEAIAHPYFTEENPAPQDISFMPTYPTCEEGHQSARRKRRKHNNNLISPTLEDEKKEKGSDDKNINSYSSLFTDNDIDAHSSFMLKY